MRERNEQIQVQAERAIVGRRAEQLVHELIGRVEAKRNRADDSARAAESGRVVDLLIAGYASAGEWNAVVRRTCHILVAARCHRNGVCYG